MTTWVFQGNPERFDIDGYLAATSALRWTVRQKHFAERMMPGDRVFIWRAEGDRKWPGGVVASGRLTSPPTKEPEDPDAVRFWAEEPTGSALRVRVDVDRVADKKEVVKRDWLKDDPILSEMRIIRMPSETNFELTVEQAQRLEALWLNTGRDWNPDESMAGLWAYSKTYAGEVSRGIGSPVSDVATRIGRAVTGVYNKVMNFRALDPRDERDGLSGGGVVDEQTWAKYYVPETRTLDGARLDRDFRRRWPQGGAPAATGTSGEAPMPPEEGPSARESGGGQGYESDPAVRKAVENRAMALAIRHYSENAYVVTVTASTRPYDLSCKKDGEEVRVEVKGTRGDGSVIEVTIGEVENARGTAWRTDLFVVSEIVVSGETEPVANEGAIRIVQGWAAGDQDLAAIRFRCKVPT